MLFSYHLLYFCTALSLIIMLSSHYHHHKSKTFSQLTQCPFTGTLLLFQFKVALFTYFRFHSGFQCVVWAVIPCQQFYSSISHGVKIISPGCGVRASLMLFPLFSTIFSIIFLSARQDLTRLPLLEITFFHFFFLSFFCHWTFSNCGIARGVPVSSLKLSSNGLH